MLDALCNVLNLASVLLVEVTRLVGEVTWCLMLLNDVVAVSLVPPDLVGEVRGLTSANVTKSKTHDKGEGDADDAANDHKLNVSMLPADHQQRPQMNDSQIKGDTRSLGLRPDDRVWKSSAADVGLCRGGAVLAVVSHRDGSCSQEQRVESEEHGAEEEDLHGELGRWLEMHRMQQDE